MADMRLRLAIPKDAESVVDISNAASVYDEPSLLNDEWSLESWEMRKQKEIKRTAEAIETRVNCKGEKHYWVVVERVIETVMGMETMVVAYSHWRYCPCALEEDPWWKNRTLHLEHLATLPQYKGRGAGTMLIDWGKQEAEQRGFNVVVRAYRNATGFYEKMGFKYDEYWREWLNDTRQMRFDHPDFVPPKWHNRISPRVDDPEEGEEIHKQGVPSSWPSNCPVL